MNQQSQSGVKMFDGQQVYQACLHGPEGITWIASGPREWIEGMATVYLNHNEVDPEADLVISRVEKRLEVGHYINN